MYHKSAVVRSLLALTFLWFDLTSASRSAPRKFLIVSAPRTSRVSYVRIPRPGDTSTPTVNTLIGVGLTHPQGLAVDQRRKKLYVADPDSYKIYAYDLHDGGDSLSVTGQTVVAENTEARWVALDGTGNIYFTDEPSNKILKMPVSQVDAGNSTPMVLYESTSLAQVNAPGGIAVDSFYTYWTNKHIGSQVGSIVKGLDTPSETNLASNVQVLSRNTDKSYGVCVALNNVFYTQPESTIYGVKKTGSTPRVVSNRLVNPRGCAYDGDGTVYVADRGANAIYSFAGNMQDLSAALLSKTVDYEDAFGLTVFSKAAWTRTNFFLLASVLGSLLIL